MELTRTGAIFIIAFESHKETRWYITQVFFCMGKSSVLLFYSFGISIARRIFMQD